MGLCWHTFKNYADRLFRKRSSHGPMLAYLMLHLQVGIRTQTRTEIAILSAGHGAPVCLCHRCQPRVFLYHNGCYAEIICY